MIPNIYKGNYKLLVIIPLLLIVISIYFIPSIELGVDFRGGMLFRISINEEINEEMVYSNLVENGFNPAKMRVYLDSLGQNVLEIEMDVGEDILAFERKTDQFLFDVDELSILESTILSFNETQLEENQEKLEQYKILSEKVRLEAIEILEKANIEYNESVFESLSLLKSKTQDAFIKIIGDYEQGVRQIIQQDYEIQTMSVETISASLSETFIEQAIRIMLISIVLSILVVFLVFREFIPSIIVLIGAFADVLIALGFMGFYGVPLTLASFAALLMLIGYSLDTDILLAMKVIKRRDGAAVDRAYESMQTGISMSMTSIVAFGSLFILSVFTNIATYYEISIIMLIGLFADIFVTWCLNSVLILWHAQKKEGVLNEYK